ncbi:hypothetical protein Hanom_Chr05g00413391 [Helianthus anomalus]
MGVRPLHKGEKLLYKQMRMDFMYPTADAFSMPPTATKGAQFLNPRPCRAITLAGEEVILLSSEESIASRIMEASVAVYDAASRKGIAHPQQRRLDDYVVVADSMEELKLLGGKFKTGRTIGAQSSGSLSSKEQLSGATPMSAPVAKETEADPVPELTRNSLNASARNQDRLPPKAKKVVFRKPVIRKKANLGSLMSQIPSPENEAEKITEQVRVDDNEVDEGNRADAQHAGGADAGGEGTSSFGAQHKEPSHNRPKDTLDDHYYRSYDESHAGEIHTPVWKLKKGNTFGTFATCHEWFIGTFPPTEVIHVTPRSRNTINHNGNIGESHYRKLFTTHSI